MKARNISKKPIIIGEVVLMIDDEKKIPVKAAELPAVKALVEKKQLLLIPDANDKKPGRGKKEAEKPADVKDEAKAE